MSSTWLFSQKRCVEKQFKINSQLSGTATLIIATHEIQFKINSQHYL
jgi:hypothetical protein